MAAVMLNFDGHVSSVLNFLDLVLQRLDSYYKRNYRDYFGFSEGTLKEKKDLTESEKGILEWLEANK